MDDQSDGDEGDASDASDQKIPTEAIENHISTANGSGSLSSQEDWVRANSRPEANDGRSTSKTTFYPWEGDGDGPPQAHRKPRDRRSWESLASWNDDERAIDVDRAGQNRWADRMRWIETFARQIGATDRHIEQAKYAVEEMDHDPYRWIDYEGIILGILTLLIDQEVSERASMENYQEAYEQRAFARDGLQRLMDDLEMEQSDLVDVRRRIRENDYELLFPDS